MAILIDETKKVMIQGLTGLEGVTLVRPMVQYGTHVVAGCTPGKGGQEVAGVPIFDTVEEAMGTIGPIGISVLFVPAPRIKNAALEAIAAGIKLLVIVPGRVPIYDVLVIAKEAKATGARFAGPNTLGMLSPDKGMLGMMNVRERFFRGPVGVTSRSGSVIPSMAYYLAREGIGISTLVHVGSDAVVGLPHPEVVRLFEADPDTEAVVMFGEIGTSQEEQVADLIERGEFTKPLIAYIGGKGAPNGTRFSHAGAIVEGNRGTFESKVQRLKEVGAVVVEAFDDLPQATRRVLEERGIPLRA